MSRSPDWAKRALEASKATTPSFAETEPTRTERAGEPRQSSNPSAADDVDDLIVALPDHLRQRIDDARMSRLERGTDASPRDRVVAS